MAAQCPIWKARVPKIPPSHSPGNIFVDFLWQEVDLAAGVAAARRVEQFHEGQKLKKGKWRGRESEYNRWLRSKSYIKIMVPIEKEFLPRLVGKTRYCRRMVVSRSSYLDHIK